MKQGVVKLSPEFVEQMKVEGPTLGFAKLAAPHPSIAQLAADIEKARQEQAAPKLPRSLACLTLALPPSGWR